MNYRERVRLAPASLLASLLASVSAGLLAVTGLPSVAAPAQSTTRQITYTQWDSAAELRAGAGRGVAVAKGRLVLASTGGSRLYQGTKYDVGRWTSPVVAPGYGVTRLVASWEATTPGNSWVEVRVRVSSGSTTARWQVLGRWASGDRRVRRTSVPGQSGPLGRVDVDTWKSASSAGATSYQLQVRLMRRSGARSASPSVDMVGAVASRLPSGTPAVSAPGVGRGIVLDVPRYSQMIHRGDFEEYGGGGEAWCSPTSVAMVLAYYDSLPGAADYAWVGSGHVDPWVDEVARRTYDKAYEGTGNWSFNTAYAATRTGHAMVTKLRSLREAEDLVAAGIPVVASISFASGALGGAPISSSRGHLLVIVGFTDSGDVVVNDPAASTRSGVRRTYDRAQFEAAWLPASGGLAYLIRDDPHPLPPSSGTW